MSADNWAICPKCYKEAKKLDEEYAKSVTEKYGKIPLEEFQKLNAEYQHLKTPHVTKLKETFREDYEMGVGFYENGSYGRDKFNVSYKGACEVCNFTVTFKHQEALKI